MKVNIGAATWEPVLQAIPHERDDLPVVDLNEEEMAQINECFELFDKIQLMLWDKVDEWKATQPKEEE
jgi:hypothetical protein